MSIGLLLYVDNIIFAPMKLLSINTVATESNAPAKIMLGISKEAKKAGIEPYICYGRKSHMAEPNFIWYRVGRSYDIYSHTLLSRLGDSEGLHSVRATKRLIEYISSVSPDIIHLHNIHGHYVNYPLLFEFLKHYNCPVVWTLHDCWAYTGHCAYYSTADCQKWKHECSGCPQKKVYPKSYLLDKSKLNYSLKREFFTGVPLMNIVVPSDWLKREVQSSFLCDYPIHVIHNGVDTDTFQPIEKSNGNSQKIILGVASTWEDRKGLSDIVALSKMLPSEYKIVLAGMSAKAVPTELKNVSGLGYLTPQQMAKVYSKVDIFLNTSREETFGMTTIESLACQTPVIVNNKTALPEIVDVYGNNVAKVIDTSDTHLLLDSILEMTTEKLPDSAVRQAYQTTVNNYSEAIMCEKYLNLYSELVK